tara:strand:- start:160 stop:447 length:288 start_codon:yes stop_codon:yes gene_type:complete
VHWKDAVADVGWEEGSKSELHSCTSVGFIIDETKDALTLANTISQDQSNCRIHIPKKWIQKRKDMKLENKQQKRQRKKSTTMGERLNNKQVQPYK